jgi:hypothetical protein
VLLEQASTLSGQIQQIVGHVLVAAQAHHLSAQQRADVG